MKKRMLLLTACCTYACLNLHAQNWTVAGNTLDTTGKLGSINSESILFISNNKTYGKLTSGGLWGFGNTSPKAQVHINSKQAGRNPLQIDVLDTVKMILNSNGGVTIGDTLIPPANGLYLKGKLGIGINTPDVKLHVTGGSSVRLNKGGAIVVGQITDENLAIDHNTIQARDNGSKTTLFLNRYGGDINMLSNGIHIEGENGFVGIGTQTPEAKLQVIGGTDITSGGGGYIVTGDRSHEHLVIDTKGIQARNSSILAYLYLNPLGPGIVTNKDLFFGDPASTSGYGARLNLLSKNILGSEGSFVSAIDRVFELGTSSNRWFDVWSIDGSINTSDERDKKNIRSLNYGLKEIMQLKPVRFNWKNSIEDNDKIGLVAQDLQKVLPEVVKDHEYRIDTAGKTEKIPARHLGVMYADIIPVLIKAIQEQQQEIDALKKAAGINTSTLSGASSLNENPGEKNITAITLSNASLEQNIPNPLSNNTSIHYNKPANAKNASIAIHDMSGKLIKQITLIEPGSGIINIDASSLSAGIYTYSLIIDGVTTITKKMLVAR